MAYKRTRAEWSQDAMYSCHVHLLAFDFLSLQASPSSSSSSSSSSFSRKGRPVYRVEVLGMVVGVDRKENYLRFVLDDGSGCIPCILWLNFFSLGRSAAPHPKTIETEVRAELGFQDAAKVKLGALLRVQGRVSSFRNHIQVTVSSLQAEPDPNAELLHWLDCMRLAIHHYDLPLSYPPKRHHV